MSACSGPDCTDASHKLIAAAEAPERKQEHKLERNIIVRRAFTHDGKKFYFRMADGSLIKPETAIRKGLIEREAYEMALKEEEGEVSNGQHTTAHTNRH